MGIVYHQWIQALQQPWKIMGRDRLCVIYTLGLMRRHFSIAADNPTSVPRTHTVNPHGPHGQRTTQLS